MQSGMQFRHTEDCAGTMSKQEKTRVVFFCETLRQEVLSILGAGFFPGVWADFYPHWCLSSASPCPDEMAEIVRHHLDEDREVLVFTSSWSDLHRELLPRVTAIVKPLCIHFVAPPEFTQHFIRNGAYIITPGWLRFWMKEPDDTDPTGEPVPSIISRTLRRVVLLDTGMSPDAEEDLKKIADQYGFSYEIIPIGTEYLRLVIGEALRMAERTRLSEQERRLRSAEERTATMAMSLSLIGEMVALEDESAVISHICNIVRLISGAKETRYIHVVNGDIGDLHAGYDPLPDRDTLRGEMKKYLHLDKGITASHNGLFFVVSSGDKTVGICMASSLPFPDNTREYLNTIIPLVSIFGLIIRNVRISEELRKSEARYRGLIEDQTEVICRFDRNGYVLYANEVFCRFFGVTLEQLKRTRWQLKAYSEDIPFIKKKLDSLTRENPVVLIDNRVLNRDGELRWMQFVNRAFFDEQGNITEIQSVGRDITSLKIAEIAIQENEERYRNMFYDHLSIMLIVDPHTARIIEANFAACSYYGFSYDQLTAMELSEIGTRTKEEIQTDLLKSTRSELFSLETTQKNASGEKRAVNVMFGPILIKGKKLIFCIIHDITEKKIAEESLFEANKKLNLLSSLTRHDILNSLMALKGYLTFSEELMQDVTGKEYLSKMVQIAGMIQSQIEFTRDYQDMGMKKAVWHHLEETYSRAIRTVTPGTVEIQADLSGIYVFADPLLERVIYNLVDNALRYGGERLTRIWSFWRRDGERITWIIEDNGEGVQEAMKHRIFSKGVGKNTGLGLFLTREILAITDLSIREIGVEGEGARFEITIPEQMFRTEAPEEQEPGE